MKYQKKMTISTDKQDYIFILSVISITKQIWHYWDVIQKHWHEIFLQIVDIVSIKEIKSGFHETPITIPIPEASLLPSHRRHYLQSVLIFVPFPTPHESSVPFWWYRPQSEEFSLILIVTHFVSTNWTSCSLLWASGPTPLEQPSCVQLFGIVPILPVSLGRFSRFHLCFGTLELLRRVLIGMRIIRICCRSDVHLWVMMTLSKLEIIELK